MNRPERLALPLCIFLICFQTHAQTQAQAVAPATTGSAGGASAPAAAKETRVGGIDMILLLDKSLSMAPFFGEVKDYAAGKVLGPILIPGDRLIVELVYGKVKQLISLDIASEADKAKAIRAIRSVLADGRFTDLGAALDAAKRDLDQLGQTERPKYVLLLTDERQEAPKNSPYQATDYKLKHPSLEYVKRLDLGKFRAITVGLQVGAMVEKTAPTVLELLMDPPNRAESGQNGVAGSDQAKNGSVGGAATASERALPSWLIYSAVGLLILALAGFAVVLVLSRKEKKGKVED